MEVQNVKYIAASLSEQDAGVPEPAGIVEWELAT